VQHGLVALTKIDMVDEDFLELAHEDVKEFVRGTFLEDSPIIPVSSSNGKGISEFIKTLDEFSQKVPDRTPSSLFRLPIDRVFTMKGFGTVITGTLISGKVNVGDTIMIYPPRITSKVRGIQVHNQSVNQAEAGMRTAINFQGLEKTAINRGEILSTPGDLKSSYMVDVSLHFLESNPKPIKNRTRVRFHTGTSEVLGNLILLDREELTPGETAVGQLRLDSPVSLIRDDRFVIRSYSPIRTIAGGQVINPIPQKHKRFRDDIVAALTDLNKLPAEEIVTYHINAAGYQGVSFSDLKIMSNVPDKKLENMIQGLLSQKTVIQADKENRVYVHNNFFEKLKETARQSLQDYHKARPLKPGMSKEELKKKLPPVVNAKLFNLTVNQMIKDHDIAQEENLVRLSVHTVSLGAGQADISNQILETYLKAGLQPPYFKDLSTSLKGDVKHAREVLMHLVNEGRVIKTKDDLFFHADVIEDLKNRLITFLESQGEITTPQFKEMTGVSRKYAIPLAEYFDAKNITLRVGDVRKLRKR
jgi:selenocysteine-specific elongation factor